MIDAIKNNNPAPLPSAVSQFIQDIIEELLNKNPGERPDAKELIDKDKIQVYIKQIIS